MLPNVSSNFRLNYNAQAFSLLLQGGRLHLQMLQLINREESSFFAASQPVYQGNVQ
jgi:hypothetical protein